MTHVWIVEVRNPRSKQSGWRPCSVWLETRRQALRAAKDWRLDGYRRYRVRKYTPEKP
jgi:hypothetical protein